MPRNRISTEDKQRLIDAYANGDDYVETARLLGVNRTTAWGIVRRHQIYGIVNRPRGGSRHRKVDEDRVNNLIRTVEEHPEFTLGQLNAGLRVDLPNKPRITESCVSKTLENQMIVMKKLETVMADRNRDDVRLLRREYGTWLLNVVNGINPRENVFVDESGFNLWIARTRGIAPRGQRAVRIVGGSRGANFSY